jgi:predicted nuclease of predicted toxin-antitoxin system
LFPFLQVAFPGTSHVTSQSLNTKTDDELWEFAKAGGFTILTRDKQRNRRQAFG